MLLTADTKDNRRRRPPLSAFTALLLTLMITDVVLLLILTYGVVFPSRMKIADPAASPDTSTYDESAKLSPIPKVALKKHRRSKPYPAVLLNQR
jgi:hypothetical protein